MVKIKNNSFVIFLIIIIIAIFIFINQNNEKQIEDTEIIKYNENQVILGKPRIIPDVPKDAIPPLDFPKYVKASEVDFVVGSDYHG